MAAGDQDAPEGEPGGGVELYRALVDLAPIGFGIHVDGRLVFLNPAGAQILGARSAEELLGEPILELVHPDDRDLASARIREVIERRRPTPITTTRFLRPDGTVIHLDVAGVPVTFGGKPASQIVFCDVTDRQRAMAELGQLRQAVDTAREIVFLTDPSGILTYVNPEFTRVYGWSAEETVGRVTPRILKSGLAPAGAAEALWQRLLAKEVVRAEYPNRAKDGRIVWVEGSASAIVSASGEITGFLGIQRDVSDGRQQQERLRLAQFSVEHASHVVLWIDPEGRILYGNEVASSLTGYAPGELVGMHASGLDPSFPEAAWPAVWADLKARRTVTLESVYLTKDGRSVPVEITAHYLELDGKEYNFAFARDIADRKELSAQLQHAQKMEAVGRLAGGVAHDFNNLLTVITSFSQFLHEELDESDPLRSDVDEIRKAADRAAALTRQLLVFSRRQPVTPVTLDLNAVIADLEKLLRRIIGENVQVVTVPSAHLWPVQADPGQLEQVLANLAVNSKDAMPDGGQLVIATSNRLLSESDRRPVGLPPGRYVRLEVRDTGTGMAPDVAARAFDPFFTTKPQGKGTGLGLSIVYGTVKQLGGDVELRSAPGNGTTVVMLLPAVDRVAGAPVSETPPPVPQAKGQTILVVEDEDAVRAIAVRTLLRGGYKVEQARSAGEAILICERTAIDLLLTDVVMPAMSGHELAQRLQREHPDLPVLFMSGYPGDDVADADMPADGAPVLQKPFSQQALLQRVSSALLRARR